MLACFFQRGCVPKAHVGIRIFEPARAIEAIEHEAITWAEKVISPAAIGEFVADPELMSPADDASSFRLVTVVAKARNPVCCRLFVGGKRIGTSTLTQRGPSEPLLPILIHFG